MTPGYEFAVTCARCGGTLRHVVAGRPIHGTEVSAIAHCVPCNQPWHISVFLRPGPRDTDSAGRQRRHRAGVR